MPDQIDFIDLLDFIANGYRTTPRAILGSEQHESWSWRDMLVFSQAIKRRLHRRAEAQRHAADQQESAAAAELHAKRLEAPG